MTVTVLFRTMLVASTVARPMGKRMMKYPFVHEQAISKHGSRYHENNTAHGICNKYQSKYNYDLSISQP
jgi:hypothetical protein